MAITGRSRGGHPDFGLGGVSTGHSAGSGMESQMGGTMIGPDAYGGQGLAPIGGYSPAYQEMMQQRQHQAQLKGMLTTMQRKWGYDFTKSYLEGYLSQIDPGAYPTSLPDRRGGPALGPHRNYNPQETASFNEDEALGVFNQHTTQDVIDAWNAPINTAPTTKSVPISGVPLAKQFGNSTRSRNRGLIGRNQMSDI